MKRAAALILVVALTGCSVIKRGSKLAARNNKSQVTEARQEFRAASLPSSVLFIIVYPTNDFPFGLTASNYWWDLQVSTDLINWVTVRTNQTSIVEITNRYVPYEFFRLKGHL